WHSPVAASVVVISHIVVRQPPVVPVQLRSSRHVCFAPTMVFHYVRVFGSRTSLTVAFRHPDRCKALARTMVPLAWAGPKTSQGKKRYHTEPCMTRRGLKTSFLRQNLRLVAHGIKQPRSTHPAYRAPYRKLENRRPDLCCQYPARLGYRWRSPVSPAQPSNHSGNPQGWGRSLGYSSLAPPCSRHRRGAKFGLG